MAPCGINAVSLPWYSKAFFLREDCSYCITGSVVYWRLRYNVCARVAFNIQGGTGDIQGFEAELQCNIFFLVLLSLETFWNLSIPSNSYVRLYRYPERSLYPPCFDLERLVGNLTLVPVLLLAIMSHLFWKLPRLKLRKEQLRAVKRGDSLLVLFALLSMCTGVSVDCRAYWSRFTL